jgi:hypoxanthine phosphoribosyltransferase
MEERITLHDREFILSITPSQIREAVTRVASEINRDMAGEDLLFISILNGAFMFTADLLRSIGMNCQVTFVKLSSYRGASSTGIIKELIGLNEDIRGRPVIVVEDIVDTGATLSRIMDQLTFHNPGQIRVATLLLKPAVFDGKIPVDYVGLEVPNDFIVGYGLDYNGLGRNLEGIYRIV